MKRYSLANAAQMDFGAANADKRGGDLMVLLELRCRQLSSGAGVGRWRRRGVGGVFGCLRYQYEIALIQECVPGRIYYGA